MTNCFKDQKDTTYMGRCTDFMCEEIAEVTGEQNTFWYMEFIRQAVRDKLALLKQEPTAEELEGK